MPQPKSRSLPAWNNFKSFILKVALQATELWGPHTATMVDVQDKSSK